MRRLLSLVLYPYHAVRSLIEIMQVENAHDEWLLAKYEKAARMKTYIVYVNGEEKGTVKAASHNAAEKKAKAKFPKEVANNPSSVSVAYTEV